MNIKPFSSQLSFRSITPDNLRRVINDAANKKGPDGMGEHVVLISDESIELDKKPNNKGFEGNIAFLNRYGFGLEQFTYDDCLIYFVDSYKKHPEYKENPKAFCIADKFSDDFSAKEIFVPNDSGNLPVTPIGTIKVQRIEDANDRTLCELKSPEDGHVMTQEEVFDTKVKRFTQEELNKYGINAPVKPSDIAQKHYRTVIKRDREPIYFPEYIGEA